MNEEIANIKLIDQYLDGELNDVQQKEVEARLKEDADFAALLEDIQAMRIAAELSGRASMKQRLREVEREAAGSGQQAASSGQQVVSGGQQAASSGQQSAVGSSQEAVLSSQEAVPSSQSSVSWFQSLAGGKQAANGKNSTKRFSIGRVLSMAAAVALLVGVSVWLLRPEKSAEYLMAMEYFSPYPNVTTTKGPTKNSEEIKNLALNSYDLKKYKDAVKGFSKIYKVDNFELWHINYAAALLAINKPEESKIILEEINNSYPSFLNVICYYNILAEVSLDNDVAISQIDDCIKIQGRYKAQLMQLKTQLSMQ